MVAHWDWVLYHFRLPLAKALRERGYEVILVCPRGDYVPRLEREGFRFARWNLERQGLNPFKELLALLRLAVLYLGLAPDLVHHFTMKPNLYGTISARLAKVPAVINTFTGLGYLLSTNSKARWLRALVFPLLRWTLHRSSAVAVCQNASDRQTLLKLAGIPFEKTIVIAGSGVDTHRYRPEGQHTHRPKSRTPVVFTATRLLSEKGVKELVEAARQLKANGVAVRFWLAGTPDKGNPTCIPDEVLEAWRRENTIEFLGHRSDIPELLQQADVAVLASSYHEGVPRFLLEAAATGLPLVATNIDGCRMVVRDGENGVIVPERDSKALARAIEVLLEDPILRQRMGQASRRLAVSEFDEKRIVAQYLDLYRKLGVVPQAAASCREHQVAADEGETH